MANWYGIYDDTTKSVEGAAFFADPGSVVPDVGKSLTAAQTDGIPDDLIVDDVENYTYNTVNSLVEAKV